MPITLPSKLKRHFLTDAQKKAIRKAFVGVDRMQLTADLGLESRNLVDQIASGASLCSPHRAIFIEAKAGVPASVLRPDIFDYKRN